MIVFVSVCSFGLWKIVAKFQNNPQESFSAQFEVKEYGESLETAHVPSRNLKNLPSVYLHGHTMFSIFAVLPSFEVKLTPVTSFFYVDSPELTVSIKATYVKYF